jgi:6,7-dimethyl-8-ribityllumazine synthase
MQREFNQSIAKIDQTKIQNARVALVVSRFNDDITGNMCAGAIDALKQAGIKKENIDIHWVPGAFELPLACKKLAQAKLYQGLIALGCVIKGDTDHYYYISNETSRGIMQVMLEVILPIGFGVITVANLEQAAERSHGEHNKGSEAARAVLEMMSSYDIS